MTMKIGNAIEVVTIDIGHRTIVLNIHLFPVERYCEESVEQRVNKLGEIASNYLNDEGFLDVPALEGKSSQWTIKKHPIVHKEPEL